MNSSLAENQVLALIRRKCARELADRLIKKLYAFVGNRIGVRFAYEWHDDAANWFRSWGKECRKFDERGSMTARYANVDDLPIRAEERKHNWPLGVDPTNISASGFGLLTNAPPAQLS